MRRPVFAYDGCEITNSQSILGRAPSPERAVDALDVEQGDGAKFTYKVVITRTYDQTSYDRDDLFKPISDKPGLNIITCDGTYDKQAQTYSNRLVVYTELQ